MSATLTIERLSCRYRMPREEPNPWAVRSRLDQLAREQIGDRWPALLAPLVPESEPGVLVIRRLDVRLHLGTGLPDDTRLAALWGRGIAAAVARAMVAEPDGVRVMWFPSRAAYLARFAEDTVSGAVAGRWYYTLFSAVMGLLASAVVREAFRRERASVAAALGLLDERDRLGWLTALLTDADAEAILEAIEPSPGDSALLTDAALVAAVEAGRARRWWSGRSAAVALHLIAAATRATDTKVPSRSLLEGVRDLASVLPLVRRQEMGDGGSWRLAAAKIRGQGEEARRALDALVANHPAVAAAALRTDLGTDAASGAIATVRGATAYGGVFLLLSGLAELDLQRLLREAGLPETDVEWCAPLGRWLILLKCLGPEHRAAAPSDPALLLAAGLDRIPDRRALRRLARATTPVLGEALGSALAAWVVRARLVSAGEPPAPARSLPNPQPAAAASHRSAADEEGAAGPSSPEFSRGTAVVASARTPGRRWVLVERDGETGLWLRAAALAGRPGAPVRAPPTGLPPAAAEIAHLHTAGLLNDTRADLVWSRVAAVVLHLFARRLPGFGLSSAGYLCRNFLHGTSLIEQDVPALTVDLPRVPLQVVLRMAGTAGRYDIPWLPGGALTIETLGAYNDGS